MPQVLIEELPFGGAWPGKWLATSAPPPFVMAFRLKFPVTKPQTARFHVSGDERYELFLNGQRIGRGPQRSSPQEWFFATHDEELAGGDHVLVARLWCEGESLAPFAQFSQRSGFYLAAEGDLETVLTTGIAPWEMLQLPGIEFKSSPTEWGVGARLHLYGAQIVRDLETATGFLPAASGAENVRNDFQNAHLLAPATLPPQWTAPFSGLLVRHVDAPPSARTAQCVLSSASHLATESPQWQAWLNGEKPLHIAAHTRRRVLVDAQNYVCAYPELTTSGGRGARIRLGWQEGLFEDEAFKVKGHRDLIEGKKFGQIWWKSDITGDEFFPSGAPDEKFELQWWRCGRFLEFLVETGDEPLILRAFSLQETRYPLENEAIWSSEGARLDELVPFMVRTLQMCAHEHYMDCPFYEQLQYIGDTRLQALVTYMISPDTRLPQAALRAFDLSRSPDGMTFSRYPSRVVQQIRGFTLWFVAMVHDFALWRDDAEFVRSLLPGARAAMDGFERFVNAQGLVQTPDGPNFNFTDWVTSEGAQWNGSAPAGKLENGDLCNSIWCWQRVWVWRQVAQLEEWFGDPELCARAQRKAQQGFAALHRAFWNPERGLYSDDLQGTSFSEHAQALALLADAQGEPLLTAQQRQTLGEGLVAAPDLVRATIYFSHYVFEALRLLKRPDTLVARLDAWFDLLENGLKTTVEQPEPTRSDCHAWGAHPLFHFHSTLAGVRPVAPGFSRLEITPQPGPLVKIRSKIPHPRGWIDINLEKKDELWHGEIALPAGVTGILRAGHQNRELSEGVSKVSFLRL